MTDTIDSPTRSTRRIATPGSSGGSARPQKPGFSVAPKGPQRNWGVIAAIVAVVVAVLAAVILVPQALKPLPVKAAQDDLAKKLSDPATYPAQALVSETLPQPPAATPKVNKINTTDPVVFITIDDGWTLDPRVLALLEQRKAPVTVFPLGQLVQKNPEIWRRYAALGGTIEDHTWSHPFLAKLPKDQQKAEICRQADTVQRLTGRRPQMLRPPFGSYNADTFAAAAECGMYVSVIWSSEIRAGKWDPPSHALFPGDIILLHYRPETYDELQMLFQQMDAKGLKAGNLADYLGPQATKATPPTTAAAGAAGTTTAGTGPGATTATTKPGTPAKPGAAVKPSTTPTTKAVTSTTKR